MKTKQDMKEDGRKKFHEPSKKPFAEGLVKCQGFDCNSSVHLCNDPCLDEDEGPGLYLTIGIRLLVCTALF